MKRIAAAIKRKNDEIHVTNGHHKPI